MIIRRLQVGLLLICCGLALGCHVAGRSSLKPGPMGDDNDQVLAEDAAIRIARQACRGVLNIPKSCPIKVQRIGERIVVTFVWLWPPDNTVDGPDYHARVTMNAKSGDIIEVLAGS